MRLISAFLLAVVCGAIPSTAVEPGQPQDTPVPDPGILGDWTGEIRACPQVGQPNVDEVRRSPSVVRMRVIHVLDGQLSFEFLDDVPFLLGVRGFTAVLNGRKFSASVPLALTVDGRMQEGAGMRFRGVFKDSKRKKRLRFTAEYSFQIGPGTTPLPHCLSFDLVREGDRADRKARRESKEDSSARLDDLDPRAEAAVALITQNLRAEQIHCSRVFDGAGPFAVRHCRKPHQSFGEDASHVLRLVDAVLATHAPAEGAETTWLQENAVYRRSHPVGAIDLTIEFDARIHEIQFRYPLQLAPCPELDGVPSIADLEGATPPSLIPESYVAPNYPGRAMSRKKSGTVLLATVIRKDGTIGAVCVRRAEPEGLGFEEAAVEAVRQRRYNPALVNGEPVDLELPVWVEFNLH